MASKGPEPDWLRLQRKIFTRWVNQKLRGSNLQVEDIVKDVDTGLVLIGLIESLSDKKFDPKADGKVEKAPKMRVQKIDNVNTALKFVYRAGVVMKLKPSPEDLVDGNVANVLGLIWAIMMKYMKIGDDEEGQQLSAKDALLMWVQSKTNGYKDVKVEDFLKSFQDGLALCALIHKHRPKLIPYEKLSKENKKENLQLAMDAANQLFGLEKYLSPEDIPKLDENSMVIYVSEYYYGIYEQRKLDLAARRIGKVIKLTKENDAMKTRYNEESVKLRERLNKVEKILENRTIDNTLSGAKRRIEEFYDYKTNDKNAIIGAQLDLEALYNNLAVRLSHNKRPAFEPPSGLSLRDIVSAISHLEECEQERKIALHVELNRQIRLLGLFEQHTTRFEQLKSWIAEKETYLTKKEIIDSVSSAQLQLRLLDAYDKESQGIFEGTVQTQFSVGTELVNEKYEQAETVSSRDKEVKEAFSRLGELSKTKRPVLEDDLARETFKAKVLLMNQSHIDAFDKLKSWIAEKEAYLNVRESVTSVASARTNLSFLDSYDSEQQEMTESVKTLKNLGAEVLAQKYSTSYSSYSLENPAQVGNRESEVDTKWELLTKLSAEKRRILDDHLAREEFKEKVLLMNQSHIDYFGKLRSWIAEKEAYLNTREAVASVTEARTQLSFLDSYDSDQRDMTQSVKNLQTLGADLLAQKYSTSYSSYSLENPEQVGDREAEVTKKWELLSQLSAEKRKVLDDHLAREEFKEKVLTLNSNHINKHSSLQSWIAEKEAYLNTRESITSVSEARTQLSFLDSYDSDQRDMTQSVKNLKSLGAEILAAKYSTSYSSYSLENPSQVGDRESEVDTKWELLTKLSAEKRKILDDHLAREEFKEKVLTMNSNHINKHSNLQSWIIEKEAYLNNREAISSVAEARTQLSFLDSFDADQKDMTQSVNALKSLGQQILSSKYTSAYSSYSLENPSQVTSRESEVDTKWELLTNLSSEKRKVLDDHLAREEFKEKVRTMNSNHINKHSKLQSWIAEKEAYLNTREKINSVTEARTQLSFLDSYDADQRDMTQRVNNLKSLGADILAAKYSTNYSSWSIENPSQVGDRESEVDAKWELLTSLSAEKRRVLDDHLAREIFKEKVLTMNSNHVDKHTKLQSWASEKETYLRRQEFINSIAEAQLHLGQLDSYEAENKRVTSSAVTKLKELGADILAQKYSTSYSSYTFENPSEIQTRESSVDEKWVLLSQLNTTKRKTLEEALAREIEKERLRLEYAHLAGDFIRWSKETSDNLASVRFGFTLEEVESYQVTHDTSTESIKKEADDRKSGYEIVSSKMKDMGVTENIYTTLTLNDLEKGQSDLASALEKRKSAYFAELKKQRDNDNLCKEFANIADPFSKWIIDQKDVVTRSTAALEDQFTNVNQRIADFDKDALRLKEIQDKNAQMDSAGITNNRHSSLTAKDVEVQYEQYKSFMLRKKKMLEEEIEHQKLRGISAEQYKEIEDNFKLFDTDNSGHIDRKELKACLYSLGEEKTNSQVDQILKEFGSPDVNGIKYERFRDFMVTILAVTDTKDDVLNAFKVINYGEETTKLARMDLVMAEDDVSYIKSTAPLVGTDVWDYKQWTDVIFAR